MKRESRPEATSTKGFRATTTTARGDTRSAQPIIELVNVEKRFASSGGFGIWESKSEVRAVDGVSLELQAGEVLSLVGESGSGKTTTARMILNILRPDAGVVRFRGQDISRLRGAELRAYRAAVQAVFQDPWSSLNPRLRVASIIAEPLRVNTSLSKSEIIDRVDELLTAVGLDPGVRDNYPHQFSGGQRQRIALARALSLEPQLLVLDEPVSALDVSIQAQIMNLLKDLQQRLNLSYVIIAHDLATVRYLSDRVAVMYLGRIVELGDAQEIFEDPGHPYTKALISAAATSQDFKGAGRKRIILHGDAPSPADPPPGCRFHTRCWLYERFGQPDVCTSVEPERRQTSDFGWAECHFVEPRTTRKLE